MSVFHSLRPRLYFSTCFCCSWSQHACSTNNRLGIEAVALHRISSCIRLVYTMLMSEKQKLHCNFSFPLLLTHLSTIYTSHMHKHFWSRATAFISSLFLVEHACWVQLQQKQVRKHKRRIIQLKLPECELWSQKSIVLKLQLKIKVNSNLQHQSH